MNKSYRSETRRLTIFVSDSDGPDDPLEIWAELETLEDLEPKLHLDVALTRYGAHKVFTRDEALSCSSGRVTVQALKDIRFMEQLYAFLTSCLSMSAEALFATFEAQKEYFAFI